MVLITHSAASDLWYFSIIFFSILAMYAYAGLFLFGQDLSEYETWPSSFQSCFNILLGGGDFDRTCSGEYVYVYVTKATSCT